MQTVALGTSQLQVSKICLGTMTFGEQNSESEAHAQLDYALERGINVIDSAEMYPVMQRAETQGKTEQYIGSWLKKSGARDKVILTNTIIGAMNLTLLKENIEAFDVQRSTDIMSAIETIHTDINNTGQ
ncbi:aldo/keto reductase [Undibacterium jejuense]|uniref:Aldo/keto reductase n=1 Tax=Undibacterium jejuense TaxID=1344949 RepID=A0A923HF74_9BURK|nr:aldo/keto reductase [Undibacterium jejuense]